ncbi:MAG: flagellar protein FliT [Eubacteriales bacterium]|nr:flagellar protein FliT [Eubacteriales bacterium]MDD3199228.1 flagellar protein FliT [Eubacteriales bacterium]MDD4121423.1 flagellar protein FliT [Eubacteriales bacterium]MDD4629359.1 flagellar protein FliT [Eubacteriales bacterium]
MSINTSFEYYRKKKALLKECLALSEELISSIEDWDAIPVIITKREALIGELRDLEETARAPVKVALTKELKQELDQMIRLILNLDKDVADLIRTEQQNVLDSLKKNTKGQKLTQYAQTQDLARGSKLDYKK